MSAIPDETGQVKHMVSELEIGRLGVRVCGFYFWPDFVRNNAFSHDHARIKLSGRTSDNLYHLFLTIKVNHLIQHPL